MSASALRPLIAICGTTGVGKSKLAIELALHLNQSSSSKAGGWQGARIINADSMQVYAGLDIITNKVTKEEMQGVEHLLMGFKAPGEQYVVGQWVQDALKLIDETHAQNQIPIIVGGTSYWIQHLIFPNRLAYETPLQDAPPPESPPSKMDSRLQEVLDALPVNLKDLFYNLPKSPPNAEESPDIAFNMHTLLSKLDSPVGSRWHWKDTRKVLRSLQIIHESGRKVSDIIQEQTSDAAVPRFRTLCFWLFAEPSVLEHRLNERCDKMLEQGLLDEVRTLQRIAKSSTAIPVPLTQEEASNTSTVHGDQTNVDYTLGIYQSIGYREFNEFLSNDGSPTSKAFADAVERMKISTRQYAKRQITWIRNKLLPAMCSANTQEGTDIASAYLLDATELGDKWTDNVQNPGIAVTDAFLAQDSLPDPLSLSDAATRMLSIERKAVDPTSVLNARQKIICEVCTTNPERPFMIEEGREWEVHKKTRLHRRLAAAQARKLNPQPRHPKDKRGQSEATPDSDVDTSTLFA